VATARCTILVISVAFSVSCTSDRPAADGVTAPPPARASVFGVYDLVSADGRVPPFTLQEGPTQRIDLLAEHVVLSPDSTWRQNGVSQTVYATSTVRDSSLVAMGTYVVRSDTIRFTKVYPGFGNPFTPYLAFSSVVQGDTMFLPVPGPWIWRRRK
jgi:hypothetical protein